jgi:arylsulfatase A-like enzyme
MIDHVYSMYDTTMQVPLIIRYPPCFAAGAVVDELVSLVDVVPTVLDASGLGEAEEGFANAEAKSQPAAGGHSLCDPEPSQRRAVFGENGRPLNGVELLERWFPQFDARTIDHPMRMVRTDRYKLIWEVDVGAQLFDVARDPQESDDVAATRLPLRNELLQSLRAWTSALQLPGAVRRFESRDAETLERLRALGYL